MLSDSAKFLEHAFNMLNGIYFDSQLPNVVITIQSTKDVEIICKLCVTDMVKYVS